MRIIILGLAFYFSSYTDQYQVMEVEELPIDQISFVTTKGKQTWGVSDARFSLSQEGIGYCMNLWIVSNDTLTTLPLDPEMDGSYGPTIECSVWLEEIPEELVGFEFMIPNYDYHNSDDYGYRHNASNNMYFYEHHTMTNIKVQVVREVSENLFELRWISDAENVFEWTDPKMKIEATLQIELTDSLKGYWLE